MQATYTTENYKLRIHHRGTLVHTFVKWYLDGDVTELSWAWDVDYMSYIKLEKLIHLVGYTSMKCIWYVNPRYSFARGFTAIENDKDVLKFAKDVEGFELVDVYVEHDVDVPDIVDEAELGQDGPICDNDGVEVDNVAAGNVCAGNLCFNNVMPI